MAEESRLEKLDEGWSRALAVVAHPDDLEFGAASAIARWTEQGKAVAYLLVTRGEAGIASMQPEECSRVREAEERASAATVGVHDVEFLDHLDGVIEYGIPLRRDIARAIRRWRPDVLITANHHATWDGQYLNMADHRHVGQAAIDAARDAGNRWVFGELLAEGLEPWSGVHTILVSGSPYPTHAVDATASLERGVASLREHKAYLAGLGDGFDPESFLRQAAAATGARIGVELAVAFEVLRL